MRTFPPLLANPLRGRAQRGLRVLGLGLGAALLLSIGAGCARETTGKPPDPEERLLIAQLTRDPYVLIDQLSRTPDGWLLVTTTQGAERRRYLLAPEDASSRELRIRPLRDKVILPTKPAQSVGIDPAPGRHVR